MGDFAWSEQSIALLKKRVIEGWSYSMIANELAANFHRDGRITKNACIGKAQRMGINLLAPARPKKPPRPARPPARPRGEKGGAAPAPVTAPPAPAVAPAPPPVVVAPPNGITFMEQRDGLCRFPISGLDTSFDGFRVCGCPCDVTMSYCASHAKRTSTPREKRRAERIEDDKRNDKRRYNPNAMFFMRKEMV